MAQQFRNDGKKKSRHPGHERERVIRDPENALVPHVDSPRFRTLLRNGATIPE